MDVDDETRALHVRIVPVLGTGDNLWKRPLGSEFKSDITGAGGLIAGVRVDGWVGLCSLIVCPHT